MQPRGRQTADVRPCTRMGSTPGGWRRLQKTSHSLQFPRRLLQKKKQAIPQESAGCTSPQSDRRCTRARGRRGHRPKLTSAHTPSYPCKFNVSMEGEGSEKLFPGRRSCVHPTKCSSCCHHLLRPKVLQSPIEGARVRGLRRALRRALR